MLNDELRQLGHRVTLLVGQSTTEHLDGSRVFSVARNMPVRFNGGSLSMPVISRSVEIHGLLQAGQFDVVHVQVPYSPFMGGRVITRLHPSTALIGTFHVASSHLLPRAGAFLLGAVTRRSLRRFDRMLCVSHYAERFARETFRLTETAVVPNMVQIAQVRSSAMARTSPSGNPSIAFLGSLTRRKGPDRLIAAVALLRSRFPNVFLTVAGEGPLRGRLEKQVRVTGLNGHVAFLGEVSESEKAQLLGSCKIACFPSRFGESFGIVLLEAIAAGAGVVLAGDNPGYAELLASCPQAICSTRPQKLAHRIEELTRDPNQRAACRSVQQELLAPYESRLVAARIVAVYREAIAQRRSNTLASFSGGENLHAIAA